MFVDGDCEIVADWLPRAVDFLSCHPDVAVVCGRRRERYPAASLYNRFCDLEWDTPTGPADSSGGDFVVRTTVYQQVGGFDPTIPAGEEPELCRRIRQAGHRIWRLDADMTWHDANMARFSQWWRRQFRTGYGGLDVESRFGLGAFRRVLSSALLWGVAIPAGGLLLAGVMAARGGVGWGGWVVLAVVALWIGQALRIGRAYRRRGAALPDAWRCGLLTLVSKLPISLGAMTYLLDRWRGRLPKLIEYKS